MIVTPVVLFSPSLAELILGSNATLHTLSKLATSISGDAT
jgi:hypothetical protein